MESDRPCPAAPVAVILNERSGQGHGDDAVARLAALLQRHGIEAEIFRAADGSIAEVTRLALQAPRSVVVAAGGDGTVSAVAACLRGTGIALAVLPVGTLNHFARDLGIPPDIEGAVRVIAQGRRLGVDLGEVNERTFVNNASLGLYPDIVRDRQRQQRRLGRGKYRAMLWATLAILRRSPFLRLSIEIDGRTTHCRSPFVFIGNNDYVMEGFNIGMRSSLRDGCLSVYTTRRRTRWGLLRLAIRALLGRLQQARDFSMARASSLRIDSRRRWLLVATDGEVTALATPLRLRVLPRALQVLVPAS
ncbi:MAG TPA: diacylglycerol kinase family protein [Usitatibacter sp.]|nr:diacylglycerol kinase family protein [Usitatibacter sp.]